MTKIIDIETELLKIYHECGTNGADSFVIEMISLGFSNGFNLAELKMFTAAKDLKEAQLIYDQIYKYKKEAIEDIIDDCKKRDNLEQLLIAVENGEKNQHVLRLIANAKNPYNMRCGFEYGSKYTLDNMYGMGLPTFDGAYLTKAIKLPKNVEVEERGSILN